MSTSPISVALVSDAGVSLAQLQSVARQLNVWCNKYFGPKWGVMASITALNHIPSTRAYINVTSPAGLPQGAAGVHLNTADGTAYALVEVGPNWSITASHELGEMLADPLGQRTLSGPSIDPNDQGKPVDYLAEPCDPCETSTFKVGPYRMSNFVFPAYYDGSWGQVDYLGRIAAPRQLDEGGYISWHDPQTNHWRQAFMIQGKMQFVDLGIIAAKPGKRLSELIDERARELGVYSD